MLSFDTLLALLFIAAISVTLCRKYQLPSVLGYLFTGFVVGPSLLNLVPSPDALHFLAELGIVFLLFGIGLEMSLSKLWAMRHSVLVLGFLQVSICIAVPMVFAYLLGMSLKSAFVASSALALSSTAIVIKQLREQGELFLPHGQMSLGLLIFQDIAAVPLLIIIPLLASDANGSLSYVLLEGLFKGAIAILLLYGLATCLLLPLLKSIAKRPQQELFMLMVLFIVLSCAWLTHLFGLSMVFGAFIAGAILSETEFKHQLEADITPFRDVLLGLFFITIGVRLNLDILKEHWYWVLWLTVMIVSFKTVLITAVTKIFARLPSREALSSGLILAHGGEFGFAMLAVAMSAGIIEVDYGQVVLLGVIFSMLLSPIMIRFHADLAKLVPLKEKEAAVNPATPDAESMQQHIIICGYGRVGQMIGRFLDLATLNYVALDNNRGKINEAVLAGEKVYFGDANNQQVLASLGLAHAKLVVVTFQDKETIQQLTAFVQKYNPNCHVIVRVHDESEGRYWLDEGVNCVVPETQELGLMLSANILNTVGVPTEKISKLVWQVRENQYQLLQGFYMGDTSDWTGDLNIDNEILRSVTLNEASKWVGQTVSALTLTLNEVRVWSIYSDETKYLNPTDDYLLKVGDVLVLKGLPQYIEEAELALIQS